MVLTCDKGLGKLLGLLLLLLKGGGQCLGLGHCWHHLLREGGVNQKSGKIGGGGGEKRNERKTNLGGVGSRVLAVHVKEGVAGAPLQSCQLHYVRTQPICRLLK